MLIGLFRILLILILIFFLVRLFNNLFSSVSRKAKKKPGRYANRKEGEVTIDHGPSKEKIVNTDKGEYVDFEEVDK